SVAAPHVTGLAALILAHHPDFQGPYKARNAQRVERLFRILKQSAQPLHLGGRHRVGAGLPDALKALNVTPHTATATLPSTDELLRQLIAMLQQGAMPVGTGSAVSGGMGATLTELKAAMHQAGLLVGNGTGTPGAIPNATPGGGSPNGIRAALQ